ncbi:MAG: FKBP-type peptidyl-prolyl cis-trans isomerase [Chitinispirillales bacterium]|jgi:FKBP-type peptidyl-prolyl cis-trans isomerase FkpA/FKBP-type peptidyl-prolyl cis-trans isomerase FklB|nr:FKBP-type peptidyl-prolyl cis-trans isomerase [Chitinispirillales bacterium]
MGLNRKFTGVSVAAKLFCAAAVLFSAGFLLFCGDSSRGREAAFDPENEADLSAYTVGRSIGMDLRDMFDSVNLDLIFMAIREVIDEAPARLPDSVLGPVDAANRRNMAERRHNRMMERQREEEEQRRTEAEQKLVVTQAFLTENAKKEGIVVTASGLQYIVLTAGAGPKPGPDDTVLMHYHGTLPNGAVFGSSRDRGSPIMSAVSGLLSGWTEALQLMPVGSKHRIYIPPALAYGDRAVGIIDANTVLIIEVELLNIVVE